MKGVVLNLKATYAVADQHNAPGGSLTVHEYNEDDSQEYSLVSGLSALLGEQHYA